MTTQAEGERVRKIIRIIPERTVRLYQCTKCKTKYRSSKRATRCESLPIEERAFRVGDMTSWRELNFCSSYGKTYRLKTRVIRIVGPTLPDEEYNRKWLQSTLGGLHVFQYEVRWRCPHCRRSYSNLFYGMELRKHGKISTRS